MKPPRFALVSPSTVEETTAFLGDSAEDSRVLAGGQTGAVPFKHRPEFEYILGVLIAPASDKSTLVRHKTQQPFRLKASQGFPDRRAAYARRRCNLLLCDPGAWSVHALDDAGA